MLTNKQMLAITLLLDGKSNQQIADEVGVVKNTIINWKKNDEFMKEYQKQARECFQDYAMEAKNRIVDLMRNGKNESIVLKACQDILSRAGFDAIQKQEISMPNEIEINII